MLPKWTSATPGTSGTDPDARRQQAAPLGPARVVLGLGHQDSVPFAAIGGRANRPLVKRPRPGNLEAKARRSLPLEPGPWRTMSNPQGDDTTPGAPACSLFESEHDRHFEAERVDDPVEQLRALAATIKQGHHDHVLRCVELALDASHVQPASALGLERTDRLKQQIELLKSQRALQGVLERGAAPTADALRGHVRALEAAAMALGVEACARLIAELGAPLVALAEAYPYRQDERFKNSATRLARRAEKALDAVRYADPARAYERGVVYVEAMHRVANGLWYLQERARLSNGRLLWCCPALEWIPVPPKVVARLKSGAVRAIREAIPELRSFPTRRLCDALLLLSRDRAAPPRGDGRRRQAELAKWRKTVGFEPQDPVTEEQEAATLAPILAHLGVAANNAKRGISEAEALAEGLKRAHKDRLRR